MKKIIITHVYMDSKWGVVDKINDKLIPYGIQIILKDVTPVEKKYDYNRSYMTNERQLNTRIDGTIGRVMPANNFVTN